MSHHNMENERWQEERAKLRASLEQSEAQRCRLELQHQQAESAQQVSVSFSWIPFLLKCSSPLDAPWDLYIYIYIYVYIYEMMFSTFLPVQLLVFIFSLSLNI